MAPRASVRSKLPLEAKTGWIMSRIGPRGGHAFSHCPLSWGCVALLDRPVPLLSSSLGLLGAATPPAPSPTTLPYQVEFLIQGDESIESALQASSNFYKRRQDPPPDAESLVHRLEADFAPMIDALWSEGYYNATIRASIGGTEIPLGNGQESGAVHAAAAYLNRAVVPITIHVETGPRFTL